MIMGDIINNIKKASEGNPYSTIPDSGKHIVSKPENSNKYGNPYVMNSPQILKHSYDDNPLFKTENSLNEGYNPSDN